VVESLQSEPSNALGEWNVDSTLSGSQRLAVRLREPLRPDHGLRLRVQARSPLPTDKSSFGLDRLKPLVIHDVIPDGRVVGLRAEPLELAFQATRS
jgi:hypothetical protein